MERKIPQGMQTMVSFIPKKFSKVGDVVKLKDENGTWTDGWVVRSAGEPTELPEKSVRQMIREHRKNTGDSLPKEPPKKE